MRGKRKESGQGVSGGDGKRVIEGDLMLTPRTAVGKKEAVSMARVVVIRLLRAAWSARDLDWRTVRRAYCLED